MKEAEEEAGKQIFAKDETMCHDCKMGEMEKKQPHQLHGSWNRCPAWLAALIECYVWFHVDIDVGLPLAKMLLCWSLLHVNLIVRWRRISISIGLLAFSGWVRPQEQRRALPSFPHISSNHREGSCRQGERAFKHLPIQLRSCAKAWSLTFTSFFQAFLGTWQVCSWCSCATSKLVSQDIPPCGPLAGELPEFAGSVRSFEEALQHWNQQVQAGRQLDQKQARQMNEAGFVDINASGCAGKFEDFRKGFRKFCVSDRSWTWNVK